MLAFPQWPMDVSGEGCRALRWVPPPRFAPYIARSVVVPRASPPLQVDDDDSSGGSSPERDPSEGSEVSVCGWRSCGAQFLSVSRLSAHVARAHSHAHHDGLFYCGWRGCTRPQRGFNARYKMLVHVRTHTNERPHTCTQCHKSFSRAENLKIHLRSHSGEKPYICPYEGCGKAYSNSSDRFKHTRTHTVDKPYCCKITGCNKRYTDPSSLRKHVKTYKHFTPKAAASTDSSPEQTLVPNDNLPREVSPLRETSKETFRPYLIESGSPISPNSHIRSSIVNNIVSPTIIAPNYSNIPSIPEANPLTRIGSPIRYSPLTEHVNYMKPLEPVMYPLRVPTYEMSYLEYSQMYEHAYRSYYSNNVSLTTPSVYEKIYTYDKPQMDVDAKETFQSSDFPKYNPELRPTDADMPLNLKRPGDCRKETMIVRPIEDSMEFQLVNCMDVPLDLSTKS